MVRNVWLLLGAIALSACSQGAPTQTPPKTVLRVSLFAWLPAAESYVKWVETDFETRHPTVDLVIRPLAKADKIDLSYDVDGAVAALTKDGEDAQDLVEIDTMILGALVARGAVVPFENSEVKLLPSAAEAITLGGTKYGAPHWTCGYFVISGVDSVQAANDLPSLLKTLKAAPNTGADVVGELDGSWDAIMLYLDAYRDVHRDGNLGEALATPEPDPEVSASLSALRTACTGPDGKSRCGEEGVEAFTSGSADALIGYSERLNPILTKGSRSASQLRIISAPLGSGSHPTLFTDALVLSPRCTEGCRNAATAFTRYLTSDAVFEAGLMSKDAGPAAVPRYLLPATETAFTVGAVAADPLYKQLRAQIANAKAFPNSGVPEAREKGEIQKRVRAALGL